MAHPHVSALNDWDDYSTFGTQTFNVYGNTFLHVLRKQDKTTFSLRRPQEIVKQSDLDLFATATTSNSTPPLTRWVTLVSFTVKVSPKKKISTYLSKTLSPDFLSPSSIHYRVMADLSRLHFILQRVISVRHARRGKGVVNLTAHTYEMIALLVHYLNSAEDAEYAARTGRRLPEDSSAKEVSFEFFGKEIEELLKRNEAETEPITNYSAIAIERYITSHSYPLSRSYPKLREGISLCSYDGAEAVSANTHSEAVRRATYKREHELISLLETAYRGGEGLTAADTGTFIDLMNCLTVTKTYATDKERLALAEHIISASNTANSRDRMSNKSWDIMRSLLKEYRTDEQIRAACLDILKNQHVSSDTPKHISKLYRIVRNKDSFTEAELVEKLDWLCREITLSSPNGADRLSDYESSLTLDGSYVPSSWRQHAAGICSSLCSLLEGNHSRVPSPAVTERVPRRILTSYRKRLAKYSVAEYAKADVLLFLQDEKDFIIRKAKRLKIVLTEEDAVRLLTLSFAYCLEMVEQRMFHALPAEKRRKIANIPDKVFFAVRDEVHPDLVVETLLTEVEDYDLIKDTFVLPEPYRHAILKIDLKSDIF